MSRARFRLAISVALSLASTSVLWTAVRLGSVQAGEAAASSPANAPEWTPLQDEAPLPPPVSLGLSAAGLDALEAAIRDLSRDFPDCYLGGEYLARLESLRRGYLERTEKNGQDALANPEWAELEAAFAALRKEALLANPLLSFDRILAVRRSERRLGLPRNWESNSSLPTTGYDNQIVTLTYRDRPVRVETLWQPQDGRYAGQMDLHWDASRILFSMPGSNGRFQVHELDLASAEVRELPLIPDDDVDNYDACYLPDGGIAFTSTAPFIGVPCVAGRSHVTNLYRRTPGGEIRQLTVDQEHNWHPRVMPDGRILYLRWEYSDLPHTHSRILFCMNPDGTNQAAYYGSNSYFPNSFFYAQPIPGTIGRVIGVATGHHGTRRSGRLLILDPSVGRHEARGVVQEIPRSGEKVAPTIRDQLVDGVWPQFLTPFPLSDKYFLVSAKLSPNLPWGIYLVDVFDNMVLLHEEPGYAFLEPIPLAPRRRPPIIPDRIDPSAQDALVYMVDVYQGPGLQGIPRGAVKSLRLVGYQFSYRETGGLLGAVGMDGPWDVKRILGTVPVEPDGSALFRVPAYTPIAVQPLDEDGRALQTMRSWFTAMPGETLSCVGCHEHPNTGPPNRYTLASRNPPRAIEPWYGPPRGFNFAREVQPVLDRHCVSCHDGTPSADGSPLPDLRGDEIVRDWSSAISGRASASIGGRFSQSYVALHGFIRRPGIESDLHLLAPMEFHAGSSELVRILERGHHGVELDRESWDRLNTWIDLNAPFHGRWSEVVGEEKIAAAHRRALELRRRYTGMTDDPEVVPDAPAFASSPPLPESPPAQSDLRFTPEGKVAITPTSLSSPAAAAALQAEISENPPATPPSAIPPPPVALPRITIELAPGITLDMVQVPAGSFVMGSDDAPDEGPPREVTIRRPFWISTTEITNEQFATFAPRHDSHVESLHGYQFGVHGYVLNAPRQPVVRVSWHEARAFCDHLSARTGFRFDLPTEAQWEYACRAGTAGPFWFGERDADFSRFANLGDRQLRKYVIDTYITVRYLEKFSPYDDWVPKDDRFDDGGFVAMPVGSYSANPWGLFDMTGNVWEWTRSCDRPYPYEDDDGRNDPGASGPRVIRGGSWYDRPAWATASRRLSMPPFGRAFNLGFRVTADLPDAGAPR